MECRSGIIVLKSLNKANASKIKKVPTNMQKSSRRKAMK